MPPDTLQTVPSLRKIHRASIYLARQLDERYGVGFSDYNATPIIWRCVHDLGLPPTMHTLCQEMTKRIDVNFTLIPRRRIGKRSKHKKGEACAPEIVAMAVVVAMCTLVYNLDSEVTWVCDRWRCSDLHTTETSREYKPFSTKTNGYCRLMSISSSLIAF